MNGCAKTLRQRTLYAPSLERQRTLYAPSLMHPSPPTNRPNRVNPSVGLNAQRDPILWHRRFGHLNMQSLHAKHTHGVPAIPALPSSLKNVSCDSCLLHKAITAPRKSTACTKPARPLTNLSLDTCGHVYVPSPHGLCYCMIVIDHHIHYMWVQFFKSKDDTSSELECIMLEIGHMHARHLSSSGVVALSLNLTRTL
jgi:hypothetical protein